MSRCFVAFFISLCKEALDDGDVGLALLTDLSKAYDCLPYKLLICKLRADACKLLKSYFCERKQRVKLGNKNSEWLGLFGGICLSMNQSRLRFKSALKFCQHNENQMRADALARSMMNNDMTEFWKDVKKTPTPMSL